MGAPGGRGSVDDDGNDGDPACAGNDNAAQRRRYAFDE